MKRKRILAKSLSAFALLSGMAGLACGDDLRDKPGKPIEEKAAPASQPVAVTVKTDQKTYRPGEPIQMTLAVRNAKRANARLPFSSGQRFDFILRRGKGDKGATLWQWAANKRFAMMLGEESLAPGKTLIYTATFDPKSDLGEKPMPKGVYTLHGVLTLMGRAPRPSASTTFTVR